MGGEHDILPGRISYLLMCVIGAVVLAFFPSGAQAESLATCSVPSAYAQGCGDAGGTTGSAEDTEITTQAVLVCRGVPINPGDSFDACASQYQYLLLADVLVTDYLYGGGQWHLVSELNLPDSGGPDDPGDPGECESGDVFSCVDMSTFGQFFSAGFMLMFAFWCLGKGVGEVVKLFR